jgi:hypothetical protein
VTGSKEFLLKVQSMASPVVTSVSGNEVDTLQETKVHQIKSQQKLKITLKQHRLYHTYLAI